MPERRDAVTRHSIASSIARGITTSETSGGGTHSAPKPLELVREDGGSAGLVSEEPS